MDPLQIKAFIDAMAASGLGEMEVAHEGWTLRLVRHGADAASSSPAVPAAAPRAGRALVAAPVATASAEAAPPPAREVLAPLYGIVHLQSAPGAAPYTAAGQPVRAGQTVAVIEAMKVFNEVQAERDGVVDAVLVTSGTEVEAGQPLLRWR